MAPYDSMAPYITEASGASGEDSMTTSILQYEFGPACATEFPGASSAITHVVAVGAHIEIGWASILAAISGADAALAVTLLRQLRGVEKHAIAVLEVGKQRLPPYDLCILRAASMALEAHRKRRNAFAHGVWAKSRSIADAIVLLGPEQIINRMTWAPLLDRPVQQSDVATIVNDEAIYRAPEFELAVREADEAGSVMTAVQQYFNIRYRCPRTDTTDQMSDEMLRLLRTRPYFDAKLKGLEEKLRRQPKAAAPAPVIEFELKYRRPDGTFVAIVRDLPYHVIPGEPYFERCSTLAERLGDALPFEPSHTA